MNSTIEAILKRSATRGFTNEPVSEEHLKILADSALAAPSGGDMQPWHFSFVTNKEVIKEIQQYQVDVCMASDNEEAKKRMIARKFLVYYNAPLVIFISTNPSISQSHTVDAGIAVENIAITAQSLGLGSVIIAGNRITFDEKKGDYFAKILGFPEGHKYAISIIVGHPAVSKQQHEHNPSKLSFIK